MVSTTVLDRLANEFDNPRERIQVLATLLEEGATLHRIARYLRDQTGGMDERRVREIRDRMQLLKELEERKGGLRTAAQEAGKLTPEFEVRLMACHDRLELDDIALQFRPPRKTKAAAAIEKGLDALALAIRHRQVGDKKVVELAADYVSAEKDLPTAEVALDGVVEILAEAWAEDPEIRKQLRMELSRGILRCAAAEPRRKGASRYSEFFAYEEPLRRIPPHRMLQIRRGEREEHLKVHLAIPDETALNLMWQRFASDLADRTSDLGQFVGRALKHALDHFLLPLCEREVRHESKERADRESIRILGENLRSVLLSPPMPGVVILGVDPGPKRGLRMAVIDAAGKLLANATVQPQLPRERREHREGREKNEGEHDRDQHAVESAATESAPAATESAPAATESAPAATESAPAATDQAPAAPAATEPAAAEPAAAASAPAEPVVAMEPSAEPAASTEAAPDQGPPAEAAAAAEAATPAAEPPKAASKPERKPRPEPKPYVETPEQIAARKAAFAEAARQTLELIRTHKVAAIGIGNGIGSREAEQFFRQVLAEATDKPDPMPELFPVEDAGVAPYASSPGARREFPTLEMGAIIAVSIARRLQDPLAEMVKVDPRLLSLGHHQQDVHQGLLTRALEEVVDACVNMVGADAAHGGRDLLARISGLDPELSKHIVDRRERGGPFTSRADLLKVPGFNAETARQSGGFLRLSGTDNPLDATRIHPDHFPVVEVLAQKAAIPAAQLVGNKEVLEKIELQALVSESLSIHLLRDLVRELQHPGKDPRGAHKRAAFRKEGKDMRDLKPGMELEGRVTNVTEFGAFVDVGVRQDGLVHISQLSDQFVKSVTAVVKVGDVVKVRVLEVDPQRRRISLTMRPPASEQPQGQPHRRSGPMTLGEIMDGRDRKPWERRRGGRPQEQRPPTGEVAAAGAAAPGAAAGAQAPAAQGQDRRSDDRRGDDRRGARPPRRPEPMTRAARAPQTRRGMTREGPRPAVGEKAGAEGGAPQGDRHDRFGGRGRERRDFRDRGAPSEPRVYTIESERQEAEARGHKGEIKSLAGLRSLFGLASEEKKKAETPEKPAPAPAEPAPPQAQATPPQAAQEQPAPAASEAPPKEAAEGEGGYGKGVLE